MVKKLNEIEQSYTIKDVIKKYPKFLKKVKNYVYNNTSNKFDSPDDISNEYLIKYYGDHRWYDDDFIGGYFGLSKMESKKLTEDYNGWKNWGTWYMSMLLGDDSNTIQEMVDETNGDVYELSKQLKQEAEYIIFGSFGYDNDSIMAEYAEYGFEQIDFYELAETFLEDIDRD